MSMEQALQLNNDVVIPAKRIREYQSNSLAKNNVIGSATITSPNFLKVDKKNDIYTFAQTSDINGTRSEDWKNVDKDEIFFEGTQSEKTQTVTIMDTATSLSAPIVRIDCDFSYFVNAGSMLNKTGEKSTGLFQISSGETKSFDYKFTFKSGIRNEYATITVVFSYSNGNLNAYAQVESNVNYIYFKKWSCKAVIKSIEILQSVSASNIYSVSGDIGTVTYLFNETTLGLSDNNEIFVIDSQLWNSKILAAIELDETKESTSENKQHSIPNGVFFPTMLFDSLTDFRNYCVSSLSNYLKNQSYAMYIGIPNVLKKEYAKQIRFDNNATVYTCTLFKLDASSDTWTYSNHFAKIQSRSGKAYRKEEASKTFGSSKSETNSTTISGNSLIQEEMYVDGAYSTVEATMASNVLDRFKNGRNTTKVSVFYDKYLDLDGSTVYNGVDGYFPKVDDIITPYTLRTKSGADLPTEVPLYTENYITNQDGSQSAVGKQFYVTSCSLEYDGDFRIELEAIEKTD